MIFFFSVQLIQEKKYYENPYHRPYLLSDSQMLKRQIESIIETKLMAIL